MLEEINEPIEVIVKFGENQTLPLKFLWHGREIPIKKINLSWSNFEGRSKYYFFAVSDNTNYFKLQFNSDNLSWTLLESYAD
ncbi:MAG: hypothetical protein A3C49_01065 [Candidatus Doudnabacteria bacterium RIFCSPHIGHO2_02_FULL_42_25]|uniref:Uncharacterized protein n=1 Tax=Candidatus Doudnabacteria bacterium RIFCSPHIGHO2_01_FULL_41_86 TaxID=1817821 RepID=A0A1F5N7Z8_9BACT|nr:MAG: hypothetical protein A2717_04100 [Candidatus Doudnabacteria bacterium RIFCSPHIGHO2_01_FULL_41_86]OGE75288.1 MAG: hypothetical protein A3K07_00635 [Candidatus Doudnabacteria bacterium RIFCSPHIGHO2_01_43_10]OGE85814.1 MAG: hypothetical protein A3E28_03445 [Candidatus Doudnabacteria bacterium RIFCSPHIGHO2_12_FULL_42_22]OGE87308.1 MAG: hypothetical protein A3C49_01065 [Candidatus Doudnabacteria bacterium RIFCSPHIGHO2_02_FULL_42_25]OGE92146.1 MAG: hypothetical protein A2895_00940 [Candidatus